MSLNAEDGGCRRFIMVQLPETVPEKSEAKKFGFNNIAELARDRIMRSAKKISQSNPSVSFDNGFKAFGLSSSNIKIWNPDKFDLEASLLSHQDSLIDGRSELVVLYELLLKRGLDLTVTIENKKIFEKQIFAIDNGSLFACLNKSISREEAEPIANEILKWYTELKPENTQVFFRDSAFNDDNVTKSNIVAILEQNGIHHVRSL